MANSRGFPDSKPSRVPLRSIPGHMRPLRSSESNRMSKTAIKALFSDIGGVLGTNGWDTALRSEVTAHFQVDRDEVETLHHLMFDSYERGYIDFKSYLKRVFFSSPRDFTLEAVRDFTLDGSRPWQENIRFFLHVKCANTLKL